MPSTRSAERTMHAKDAQRFWAKVRVPTEPNGCMEWTAYQDRHGYGKINMGGRQGTVAFAHRVAYMELVGEIPTHLVLDHLCRNPSCVRPDHLEPVTQAENVSRGNAGSHHSDKTHCPAGHPYAGANLYSRTHPDGHKNRICRTCKNARARAARATRREGST
ncbi:HNH endonuclease signature motif containing protein [Streptomyces sp. A3M-1-3]|uniref:HNH endonuclease signature motif containing protein n=1 Tax=Streptomyces sp. A3M-1-3 TaxID=2962044 RepID=UPI0035ABF26C